jgi:hypothetical protein
MHMAGLSQVLCRLQFYDIASNTSTFRSGFSFEVIYTGWRVTPWRWSVPWMSAVVCTAHEGTAQREEAGPPGRLNLQTCLHRSFSGQGETAVRVHDRRSELSRTRTDETRYPQAAGST